MESPKPAQHDKLVRIIQAFTKDTGDYATPIADLGLYRRNEPAPPKTCMVPPSIVFIAQGAKEMLVGGESYPYSPWRFLLTSVDLPANSAVIEASPEKPCLGFTYKLDLRVLAELVAQGGLPAMRERAATKSVGIGTVTESLLDPFERLLGLLEEPDAIPILSQLLHREIHYRLLLSDQTAMLRQIAAIDSQGHRVAKAIDWLKLNYSTSFRVEELAARVQMSAPTFHHHFRHLTAMSPLQYQKWLRLSEAKRLMLNEHLDAASAAFHVGYESPSQFSREYARLFGSPPKRDIASLRSQAEESSASTLLSS